ncbi:alginate lyase family protein [Paenibacillus whitsoniae]|nr:alginate lyase family protein [Paenibacillus whitsoniae]
MNFYLKDGELQETGSYFQREFPKLAEVAIEHAVQACKNLFRVPFSMDTNHWIDLGEPVNWLHNPSKDLEFTWVLNRHWYMLDLGRAYLMTHNEEFVHTFMKHLRGWREQNPVPVSPLYEEAVFFQKPGPWRLLEVGLRVQSWISAYKYMEASTTMTELFRAEFKAALAEHAQYLTSYLGNTEINHAIMHMQGLFMIGVFYHEHPRASFWRQFAVERLSLCMTRQIDADGVQCELTTHYHNGSIEMFGTPYWLGKVSGHPLPEAYGSRLRNMAAFTHAMIRPDGGSTAVGDSDLIGSSAERLALLGAILDDTTFIKLGKLSAEILWLFGRERYEKFKELQLDSIAGAPSSVAFSNTGYYFMKSEEHYLFFDAASMGGAHGHADALNMEWMWKGTLLFLDPGRYTYEEGEWRRYFKSTRAHNTITVDGLDQTPYLSTQEWDVPHAACTVNRWISGEDYDFIDASHQGYMRLEDPVLHRRWLLLSKKSSAIIIVDWLEAKGTHHYEQRFQLPTSAAVQHCEERSPSEGLQSVIAYPSNLHLHMYWQTSGDQPAPFTVDCEQGWVSEIYGIKAETSTLVGKGTFTGARGIVTLCIPEDLCEHKERPQVTRLEIDAACQNVHVSFTDSTGLHHVDLDPTEIGWKDSKEE